MKNYIIGAVIIGIAIIVGFMLVNQPIPYGGSGVDHYNREYFHAGLVQGGEITTIATATTTTLTAKQICDSSVINWAANSNEGAASTTLPSLTTLGNGCLQSIGDSKSLIFRNTSVASNTALFIVASTTSDTLLMPEATGADIIINGQNSALLTFIRTTATKMVITLTELIDGD